MGLQTELVPLTARDRSFSFSIPSAEEAVRSGSAPVASAGSQQAPVLVATGSGGAEEMRAAMDDATVQWALLRIRLGSGTFSRHRVLFLHLNGDACPALKRGRANEHTAFVQSFLRGDTSRGNQEGFHASAEVRSCDEVTTDGLLARVGHVFVADDLGQHEAKWAVKEGDKRVDKILRKPSKDYNTASSDDGTRGSRIPLHESTELQYSGREALLAVASGRDWNWVLFRGPSAEESGEPPVLGGGSGSVEEMSTCLASHQDKVLFGLLRMVFGAGRLQRTKYIFIHAVGAEVSTVRRGQQSAARPRAEKLVREFAHCSTSMDIKFFEELNLEAVIDRLRRCSVADDVLENDSASRAIFSLDAYREAQAEATKPAAQQEPETAIIERRTSKLKEMSSDEAVRLFHSDSQIDWAVFGPQEDWLRSRRSVQPTEASERFRKAALTVKCANKFASCASRQEIRAGTW